MEITTGYRFAVAKLEGETVVFDSHTATLHRLNSTATAIFDLLVDGCDRSSIAARVAGAFGSKEEDITDDVYEMVTHLEQMHLVGRSE